MLSNLQKRTAQAIINIFETSRVVGDYSLVVCAPGDPGGLTYGKSQTTINSGNLYLLIKAYTEADGAKFADELSPYLKSLKQQDRTLCDDRNLHRILRQAGKQDDVMIDTQDAFFDRVYWTSAINRATSLGIETALGTAVVYDSTIHGSWGRMRDRTIERHGRPSEIGEQAWISNYINVRREWLANHSIRILNRTVDRMDAFRKIIDIGNWSLNLPLNVRSLIISEETLIPDIIVAPVVSRPLLFLTEPYMRGGDVREVQQALVDRGFYLEDGIDSVFGPQTDAAIKKFQQQNGLVVDGIVGSATRSALGIDND
ncbi:MULTISPECIES: peptidoglycan-binding protein [unclassified Okeania]|uniref:peptidoglycan-binding protein n=1 Tax=unclassified Okeania TaxID=2634635 RepID=UPI0013B889FF|nr:MULTISPECIES: peptidoglycan-binding protein [unclassified Okeania]NET13975.1 chitosanase [Okeania sp. SIO1H6]NET21271.1 chitosanase [Okeania sp. SIO1H5]NET92652.1 chitosanase [Okeania sp. SIO1H2]